MIGKAMVARSRHARAAIEAARSGRGAGGDRASAGSVHESRAEHPECANCNIAAPVNEAANTIPNGVSASTGDAVDFAQYLGGSVASTREHWQGWGQRDTAHHVPDGLRPRAVHPAIVLGRIKAGPRPKSPGVAASAASLDTACARRP